MSSNIIKRKKKQEILRNTMLKMQAMQAKIELESGLNTNRVSVIKEEQPKTKRAKIEMETEEAKAKRVKIEIETTLKAIRDSVTKVEEDEDNNMRLVEALDLSLPLNSNNAQASTDFGPIEFKSVSDLSLHMASFSLCEIPISDDKFAEFPPPHLLRSPKLYPCISDFLPFVRLPKSS